MEATGEDEEAAQSLGINTALYKIYAFALSSTFTGLAGVLWAHSIGSVFPRNFSFEMSVLFLSMLVFGGLGTIRGAIFGAFFLYLLPECFRFIENYRMLVYGALLTMIVGILVSFLVAYASIAWLLRFVANNSLRAFIYYRIALGLVLMGVLGAGWMAAT